MVIPTLNPFSDAAVATLFNMVVESEAIESIPLFVFSPVARAVPPAAESVMRLDAEKDDAKPIEGNAEKLIGDEPHEP